MLKAIIIDDEPLARKRLSKMLLKYSDQIHVVDEAENGEQGLQKIEELKPDVLFLDIEMPVLNGFDMLQQLNHRPYVIFTTAYEQYAIKAFEENSIDYLLKPIEEERLDKAIGKLKRIQENGLRFSTTQLEGLLKSYSKPKEIKSISVKIGDRILLLKPDQIAFFEAKDKYVYVITLQNIEYITDFTLQSLEEKLTTPFLRIHRAYIINSDQIKEIYKGFNGSFIFTMKDSKNTKLNSGRSYNEFIKTYFEL